MRGISGRGHDNNLISQAGDGGAERPLAAGRVGSGTSLGWPSTRRAACKLSGQCPRRGVEVQAVYGPVRAPRARSKRAEVWFLPRLLPEILPRGQEAINRSTRFMRSLGGLQRTPSIPLNPSNEVP